MRRTVTERRSAPEQPRGWQLLEGRPFLPGRRRVAVLSPYLPYPLAHGGAVRMFHLLREAALEYDIILFAFTETGAETCEPLLEFCSRVILVSRPRYVGPSWRTLRPPEVAEVRSEVMQELWDGISQEFGVEARQVEYTQMASYGGDILVARDLNGDLYGRMASRERTPAAFWNRLRWRRYERHAPRKYKCVVVAPDGDAAMARRKGVRVVAEAGLDWKKAGAAQRDVLRRIIEPPIVIRQATERDVSHLDRIQHASPETVLWEPHSYLSYDCRVAELGGRVAGFVVCRAVSADEAEVLSLVVDPKLRRRGIGLSLMRQVLEHGPGTWYLEVRESNWPARRLYGRLGFEDLSLRPHYYQDTGETAVVMRLKPC
jgi:ribosomal-protein-alanine acetyltransferase